MKETRFKLRRIRGAARLFFVDDNPIALAGYEFLFKEKNLNILPFFFRYSSECHERISKYPPDILVTDYMMPNINGLQLCRKAREESKKRNKDVYIIMMTGDTGMGNYLENQNETEKYFNPDLLLYHPVMVSDFWEKLLSILSQRKEIGHSCLLQFSAKRINRRAVEACHCRPRAVLIPRALRASAKP